MHLCSSDHRVMRGLLFIFDIDVNKLNFTPDSAPFLPCNNLNKIMNDLKVITT